MNKLLAITVALLIGCSPATPPKNGTVQIDPITGLPLGLPYAQIDPTTDLPLGLPKETIIYPAPIGIWASDDSYMVLDFTNLKYDLVIVTLKKKR